MINRQLDEYDLNVFKDEQFEKIGLRDNVLIQMSEYCANLSQDLWINFNSKLVPKMLKLSWNSDLHLQFLQYKRLIDSKGLEQAGNAILLAFSELLKENASTKSNMH